MRKTCKQTALALAVALTVTSSAPVSVTQAAMVKNLNKAAVTKTMTVGVGCKKTIAVNKVPKATKFSYSVKNKKIATVSKKGVVKGKKTGTTVITVKLTYKKKTVVKKCKVTVKSAVKSIGLKTKTITLNKGATYQITKKNKVTVTPAKALQTVSYASSNKTVATVTSKGKVTAKKEGTAKITIKAKDGSGKKAVLTVKVKKAVVATTKPTVMPTTEPTVMPTTEPTVMPTTEPTVMPTIEPTAIPTTEPSAEPSTDPSAEPSTPAGITKVIKAADVVNGTVDISGTYDNVVIEASVGKAEITLDNITIKNTLTLNYGANYTVKIKKANISNVDITQKAVVAAQNVKVFAATFENDKVPTIVIADETVIADVKVSADVKITGSSKGQISKVTILTKSNVEIAAPVKNVTVAKEATATAMSILAEVGEICVEAANTELKVEQTGKVSKVETAETAIGTIMEVVGTVESVKADAAETVIKGTGKVTEVTINGNNSVIQCVNYNKIAVSEGVTGTTVNNSSVAGGAVVSATPSGGSSSGGNSGGSYVPSPSTPTPAPVTAQAEKTYTVADVNAQFKVTRKDGKVEIYKINKEDLRGYYHNPTATDIPYTKIEYNNETNVEKTVTGVAPVVADSLKKATITIDNFTCIAEVSLSNGKATQCKVTVTTTDTTVENIEFITNYAQKIYTKDSSEVTLTAGDTTYKISYNELDKLYDAAIGSTVTIAYTKNGKDENETVEKKENNKGSFILDDIKCETWIDVDAKQAYVTVTATKTEFPKFELS